MLSLLPTSPHPCSFPPTHPLIRPSVRIVVRHHFASKLQRMSVVAHVTTRKGCNANGLCVLSKGVALHVWLHAVVCSCVSVCISFSRVPRGKLMRAHESVLDPFHLCLPSYLSHARTPFWPGHQGAPRRLASCWSTVPCRPGTQQPTATSVRAANQRSLAHSQTETFTDAPLYLPSFSAQHLSVSSIPSSPLLVPHFSQSRYACDCACLPAVRGV